MKSHLKASGRVLLAIKGMWYDVTDFMSEHPGGEAILRTTSMKSDATQSFLAIHDASLLDQPSVRALEIGRVWQDEDNQTGKGTAYLAARKKKTNGEETKWWDRCTQMEVLTVYDIYCHAVVRTDLTTPSFKRFCPWQPCARKRKNECPPPSSCIGTSETKTIKV